MSIRNEDRRKSAHPSTSPDAGDPLDDRILDAARSCMLDFGFRRTTLAEVARRAGVSRPTVYRRWPDTRAIVADLLTREIRAVAPEPRDVGPARPQLTAAVVTAAVAVARHPLFEKMLRTDPEVLITYIVDRLGTSQQVLLDALTAGIERGQRDGTVRSGRPRTLATMVLLTAQSVVQSAGAVASEVPFDDLVAELGRAVDSYLAPRPKEDR